VLAGTQATLTKSPTLQAAATNAFRVEMPAQSVSVIVPHR
jgi:hypothetical protein